MKVGIDARFAIWTPRRGIGNYSLNLINHLVAQDDSIQYVLYTDRPDSEGVLPQRLNVTVRVLGFSFYPLWEQLVLPLAAQKDGVDILHCLGNTGPVFSFKKDIRLIATVHDVMFLKVGGLMPIPTSIYQKLGRFYRALIVPVFAKKSDAVLTVSDFSKLDIAAQIDGIEQGKIHVAYQGCADIFSGRLGIQATTKIKAAMFDKSFILCLGAEDPRKNTFRFVNAFLSLLKQGAISENLVISGYTNWRNSASYHAVKLAGAEARVKFLDFVTTNELVYLYQSAKVFAYPSLYEGFGIPILEAFSSGCPVIASNVTSIPEVGEGAALYFDPLSEEEMGQTLLRVLNNSVLHEELKERGYARAKHFSWTETALRTLAVYRACMDENKQ